MTLVGEGSSGSSVSTEDCDLWADSFGMTMPVLADSGYNQAFNYIMHTSDGTIYLPNQQLIGPGMEVLAVNTGGIPDSTIEAYLPD